MSWLIRRAIDRALGAAAGKRAPLASTKLHPVPNAERNKSDETLRDDLSGPIKNEADPRARDIIEPAAAVDEAPQDVLRRKDAIMREIFNGVIKATRPDIICDIGSFGAEEIVRFSQISPDSDLYAFEANYDNIVTFINPRLDIKGITIENLAICDVDGEITFHVLTTDGSLQELWRRAAGSLNLRSDDIPYTAVTVPSVRLDTYFRNAIEAESTFILWIDVEGALDRVFAGAEKVLARTIMFRAEVERREFWTGQKMAEDVIAMAERAGFVFLGDTWTPEASEQSDVLMINRRWLDLAVNSANNMNLPTLPII